MAVQLGVGGHAIAAVEGKLTNLGGLEQGETAKVIREGLGKRHTERPLNGEVISFP